MSGSYYISRWFIIGYYLSDSIYLTIFFASSCDNAECADMGTCPQTPVPPLIILWPMKYNYLLLPGIFLRLEERLVQLA